MIKILFVEDDLPLALGVEYTLKQEGFDVVHTKNLSEARIYDRIRAVCQPVQVKGESQRKAIRRKMKEKIRGFFDINGKEGLK